MKKPIVFELQQTVGAVAEGEPYSSPRMWHAGMQVCLDTEVQQLFQEATRIIERLCEQIEDSRTLMNQAKSDCQDWVNSYDHEVDEINTVLAFTKQHRSMDHEQRKATS